MAFHEHASSLEAWSTPGLPPAHVRHNSPFTSTSQAAFSTLSTNPVPIPGRRCYGKSSITGQLLEPLGAEPLYALPAVNGKHREVLSVPELAPGAVSHPQDDPLHTGALSSEGSIRRIRIRACTGNEVPLSQDACQDSAELRDAPSEQQAVSDLTMKPVASLPLLATQAPITLASLCTALSSPACHDTLAAAHARFAAESLEAKLPPLYETASFTASFPATSAILSQAAIDTDAAAASSFVRCIALASSAVTPASPPSQACSCLLDDHLLATEQAEQGSCGDDGTSRPSGLAVFASASTVPSQGTRPRADSRPRAMGFNNCNSSSSTVAGSTSNMGMRLLPVSPKHMRPMHTSTKRGLYEGTVRGGVPYNMWQSCTSSDARVECLR